MERKSEMLCVVVLFGALVACATLSGCGPRNGVPVPESEAVELQTYAVPQEYQDELHSMLRSALEAESVHVGRVTKGPGGTLLVVAPPKIQAGVRRILDEGFDTPPIATPTKLTYWFLVGRPADSPTQPYFLAGGRALPDLEPVLARIASAQGPTEFALLEQIELTSMNQERAQTSGRFARVVQRATRRGDQVVADVEIGLGSNSFSSQVMLEGERFLVLGQAGFAGRQSEVFADAGIGDALTLYYVMAADLAP
jgi:hypothetical protein